MRLVRSSQIPTVLHRLSFTGHRGGGVNRRAKSFQTYAFTDYAIWIRYSIKRTEPYSTVEDFRKDVPVGRPEHGSR
eukprot:7219294-Prymnesium_polylepis.1